MYGDKNLRNQILEITHRSLNQQRSWGMGCQSEKNDLKKTRANSYTLVTKLVDINYIVINSWLNMPFYCSKIFNCFLYTLVPFVHFK